jgi:hypothetical protein
MNYVEEGVEFVIILAVAIAIASHLYNQHNAMQCQGMQYKSNVNAMQCPMSNAQPIAAGETTGFGYI